MAAFALPSLVCLRSVYNDKYLRYRCENVQTRGLLQFAGETVMDPYAQFEVEKAKSWDGLVHSNLVTLTNQSSWTCTLFKPILVEDSDGTKKVRLLHVQLGHYACLWRIAGPFDSCLFAGSKDPVKDSRDVLAIIDWESIFRLPTRVAFKGDNGLFLGANMYSGQPDLRFAFSDPKDPQVVQQIFLAPDGTIFIKSPHGTQNADVMFRPSVLDTNVVALLSMKTTTFLKRYTSMGRESSLNAATQNIDVHARLLIVDVDE
ncbi:hypothetical protein Cgig2_013749 [Carnegiea gigantea]|uniref:Agglutinin domain-containing protein n=1 Tax=Carnegiea gigantea TaxID=171969 RepID=A0A9Q1QDW2_9CARY|nr:hypothetical protein Cgig2_013749 [Carnegiea gigantea]